QAGFLGGRGGVVGAAAVECDGLFHEYVLASLGRGKYLRLVGAMRRGQHHRIDAAVLQDGVVAVREGEVVLATEVFRIRARARMRGDEADVVALPLYRSDQRPPPASQPDDRGANHALLEEIAAGSVRHVEATTGLLAPQRVAGMRAMMDPG